MNLSGVTLELYRAKQYSRGKYYYTILQAVGHIPQQDRFVVIDTVVFPHLVQETIILSSMEFLPEN